MTERAIDQYDPMGRVLSERQCFAGGCGAATNYTMVHSYDLAGDVTGSNNGGNGTNAAAFIYGYDAADRLNCVSTANCATEPGNLFQAVQYSAIGLTQASYGIPAGGNAAFNRTLAYDSRMRPLTETYTDTASSAVLYQYGLGYDKAGNVTSLTNDTEMGTWNYTPDALNRLSTASATAGPYSGLTLTEGYDSFGNRLGQTASGTYKGFVPQPAPVTYKGNNNRVDQWAYDAAGDVLNDTNSGYEYDAEGRQTGTYNQLSGLTGYVYDAEGRRAMKVLVNHFGTPQATTTVENEYLLGLNGEQVSVLGAAGNWLWTNVYAGGNQLATYYNSQTYYALTDWLGTKRGEAEVQVSGTTASATLAEQCTSLPFGDNLACTGTDPNQLHFTGKERDTESTNDYFGARYYASNIAGRFLTPDTPLVDQKPGDPQSWNLYAYVRNNPLANVDPTGQDCGGASSVATGSCAVDQLSGIFVGGIIDGNSINLASQSDSLSLMYTPEGQQQNLAQQQSTPAATVPLTLPPLVFPSLEGVGNLLSGFLDSVGAVLGDAAVPLVILANPASTASEAQDTIQHRRPTADVRKKADQAATDANGNLRCSYCGQVLTPEAGKANSREYDHVTPHSQGGDRTIDNIRDARRSCNRQKGPRTPEQWGTPQP